MTSPTVIPYATIPGRRGIALERTTDRLRILVPWSGRWQRGLFVALLIAGALNVAANAAALMVAIDQANVDNIGMSAARLLVSGAFVALVVYVRMRGQQRTEIVLDPLRLRIITHPPLWMKPVAVSRPREKLAEIRHLPHNGTLLIRASGYEMLEVLEGERPETLEWLADTLSAEVGEAVKRMGVVGRG